MKILKHYTKVVLIVSILYILFFYCHRSNDDKGIHVLNKTKKTFILKIIYLDGNYEETQLIPGSVPLFKPFNIGYHCYCQELRFKEIQITYDENKLKFFKYDDLKITKDEKACAIGFTIDETFFN